MPLSWGEILSRWANAVAPYCVEPPTWNKNGPSSESELLAVEQELGQPIPLDLRLFLRHQASEINFWWFLKDDAVPLDVPDRPYAGYLEFGTEVMIKINAGNKYCLRGDEPTNVAMTLENAFRFVGVPNGDAVALDLYRDEENPPVIYLNHEEPTKLIKLADSFGEFLLEWFRLGCVGPEIWNLCHFLTEDGDPLPDSECGSMSSLLNSDCSNAIKFKSFFGMNQN